MLDHGHRLRLDNQTVTGAVDDIVKTDKLPHAPAGADGQIPEYYLMGETPSSELLLSTSHSILEGQSQ